MSANEFPTGYDRDYLRTLYFLRRSAGRRFVITHYDADIFIDEIWEVGVGLNLEVLDDDGLPMAFATDDADKVEEYQTLLADFGWQVFDNTTGILIEREETFP